MSKEIKYFSILIIIMFSSNLALAMTCNEVDGNLTHQGCVEFKSKSYNTTTPIINITFKESVDVKNDFVLYKIGDFGQAFPSNPFDSDFLDELENFQEYPLEVLPPYSYQFNNIYSYKPNVHIPDGIYLFKVSAFNIPDINIDVAVLFSINGTGMKFWVSYPINDLVSTNDKPLFAFSNESVFNLELTTERDVDECRFTTGNISGTIPLPIAFQTKTTEKFSNDTNSARKVILFNFNITQYYSYRAYDGSPRYMSVICKEKGSQRYSYANIVVGVDKSIPVINVTSDFQPVIDYDARSTNLTIKTDDVSACKINKVYTQLPEMNDLPLIKRNSTYDFTKYSEFVKSYTELLGFSANPSPYNYIYNITCTNLANLKNSKLFDVRVNLDKIQSFIFYSPQSGYINTKNNILINGSVNRGELGVVFCTYSFNQSGPFTSLTRRDAFNGRVIYSAPVSVLSDGTYTVYVTCTYMDGELSSQTFTVDSTPPTIPNITGNENSCSLEDITITAVSRDIVSGVSRYYYNLTVNAAEDEYISGTSSSGRITIDVDELEEGKSYPLKVWAEDNAGNKGSVLTSSIKVTNSSITACDKNPPTIKINSIKNNVTNVWTVTVNCTDEESGCKQQFYYGIEPNASKKCNETKQANLLTPIPITTSANFCARVYDYNNNNDSDSKNFVVTYPSHCNNSVIDANETDLNCGGTCPKCNLNKTCSTNLDCSSNYCLNKKCAQSSCTDKIKNGNEAGVDCGGSCTQKCGLNSTNVTCTSDDDCITSNCKAGKCALSGCMDKIKNGNEAGVDCGGSCTQKCGLNSTNVTCTSDDDCITLNCKAGKCLAANCTNKKQDGIETGVDCGGNCPLKCAEDTKCINNSDCSTKYCVPSTKLCGIDPSLDTDGDGMTDIWEKEHCGSITGCEPKKDLDGDKYNNIEEFKEKTDPNDPDSHPDTKKQNPVSLIFLILGVLLIIAGGTIKVLNVLDEQKKMKYAEEKEMFGALGQIPKMSSIERPLERELTEEDKIRGQQARLKALKERSAERKKMINQFDSGEKTTNTSSSIGAVATSSSDESVKENTLVKEPVKKDIFANEEVRNTEPEQKPIPLKKSKHLDEGLKDEYVDISALKSKKESEDSFSKLKTITGQKSSSAWDAENKTGNKTVNKTETKNEIKTGEKSKSHTIHTDKQSQESSKKQSTKSSKNEDVFEKLKTISKSKKK